MECGVRPSSLRNRTKVPSVLGFMRSNWTDCLALFVDIPGVTGVGALSFLVLTRFRHLIRLFRVARILKVRPATFIRNLRL